MCVYLFCTAVLGGGPGSFGIVTNIYLKTFCDYDFMDNIYWESKSNILFFCVLIKNYKLTFQRL